MQRTFLLITIELWSGTCHFHAKAHNANYVVASSGRCFWHCGNVETKKCVYRSFFLYVANGSWFSQWFLIEYAWCIASFLAKVHVMLQDEIHLRGCRLFDWADWRGWLVDFFSALHVSVADKLVRVSQDMGMPGVSKKLCIAQESLSFSTVHVDIKFTTMTLRPFLGMTWLSIKMYRSFR